MHVHGRPLISVMPLPGVFFALEVFPRGYLRRDLRGAHYAERNFLLGNVVAMFPGRDLGYGAPIRPAGRRSWKGAIFNIIRFLRLIYS